MRFSILILLAIDAEAFVHASDVGFGTAEFGKSSSALSSSVARREHRPRWKRWIWGRRSVDEVFGVFESPVLGSDGIIAPPKFDQKHQSTEAVAQESIITEQDSEDQDAPTHTNPDSKSKKRSRKSSSSSKSSLNFSGTFSHTLNPPSSCTSDDIHDFLDKDHPEHVGLLLKGGDFPVERVPATPELVAKWRERASEFGWDVDEDENDGEHELYRVKNIIPLLPGLNLHAESIMGCRRVSETTAPSSGLNPFLPRRNAPVRPSAYEFTLIHDNVVAQGSTFLVWLYTQISGECSLESKKRKKQVTAPAISAPRPRQTFSKLRVTVGPDARVTMDGSIRTQCIVPKKVISFLPVSQQRAEAKVSQSMARELENETLRSAERLTDAMAEWNSRK